MMKYETWKELFMAVNMGQITKEKHRMVMDNDCCHLYEKEGDVCLFEAGGPGDICEILELCGLDVDWA